MKQIDEMRSYLRNLQVQIEETNVTNQNLTQMAKIEGELRNDAKQDLNETSDLVKVHLESAIT